MAARIEKDTAVLEFIEEVTSKCEEEQRKVLAHILSQNANTEYLKRHGMKGCVDVKTFKNNVPVVTYEDIQPDIQRIVNGDFSPILCAQPITEFFTSSGTSAGEKKLIPMTSEEMERRLLYSSMFMPIMNQFMSDLDKGKVLYFKFIRPETKTPGGLLVQSVLTSYYKNNYLKNQHYDDPYNINTSPHEAIVCLDSFQSMYTQMLCGLYNRHEVLRIGAAFASGLLRAIRFLQVHFTDLCHDITTGTLSSIITNLGIRTCMSKIMRPDPKLAEFIIHTCNKDDNWEGIIKRIWPNTKYLDVIVTGSMAQYIPTLDYYSGGLHKVSNRYISSECFFGPNLNPMCAPSEVSYTILPNTSFFEFIPLDNAANQIVDLADVEVGKEYEIVVTTQAGLYRYKVGDVLYVTGFHNSTPQLRFIRRKNVLLSIDMDKTDEFELQNAVESASTFLKPFNTRVVDYTSYADTKTIPGHYVIYWELLTNDTLSGLDHEVLGQCALAIEQALNSVYRQIRADDRSIGALEIRVVKKGTFEKLMDYAISRGASIDQYKVPRCVNVMPIVKLLDSNVVMAQFSPSMPHWSP